MFTNLINASELVSILNMDNLVLIDCRMALGDKESGRRDYLTAHIPHAQYAHLDEDLSGEIIAGITGRHPFPKIEDFAPKCSAWGISQETQVVVYDQGHGGIAARLWFLLKWLGHEKVAVLNGGWKYWQEQGFPQEEVLPPSKSAIFIPRPISSIVGVEVIEKNLEDSQYVVIDSRARERYRGEHEPIDPVAGHIPNALSAPFLENLGEDGLFLSKEQLTNRFDSLLKKQPIEQTILYCGSGVTACHNLLALDYIGRSGAKLYPGSWSEWITDKMRPIAITQSA